MSDAHTPVIIAARRTPIGRFLGGFGRVTAPELGAVAIDGAMKDAGLDPAAVEEVFMGCVLQAGVGQNPARQAALKAGIPDTVTAVTVNKVCGSGLEAVMQAARAIKAGDIEVAVAGGMENMDLAPHFANVRGGVKYGPATMQDHMAHDGLTCAFEKWPMGNAAEWIADEYDISRDEQDRFSAQSHNRAEAAWEAGHFEAEVLPMSAEQCNARAGVEKDEGFRPGSSSGSAHLAPATATDVTIRNFHVAAFSTQTKCPAFGNGCKCVQFMLNSTKPDRVEATHSENLRLMLLCSAAGEPSLLLNLLGKQSAC